MPGVTAQNRALGCRRPGSAHISLAAGPDAGRRAGSLVSRRGRDLHPQAGPQARHVVPEGRLQVPMGARAGVLVRAYPASERVFMRVGTDIAPCLGGRCCFPLRVAGATRPTESMRTTSTSPDVVAHLSHSPALFSFLEPPHIPALRALSHWGARQVAGRSHPDVRLCTHGSHPRCPGPLFLTPVLSLSTSCPPEVGYPWVRDSWEFGGQRRPSAIVSAGIQHQANRAEGPGKGVEGPCLRDIEQPCGLGLGSECVP